MSHVFEDIYDHSSDMKIITLNLRRFHETRYVASEFITRQLATGCAHYDRENARELSEWDAVQAANRRSVSKNANTEQPDADGGLSPEVHERMLEEHAPSPSFVEEDALVNAPLFGRLESNGATHHPDIFPLDSDGGSSAESTERGAMRITVEPTQDRISESGELVDCVIT